MEFHAFDAGGELEKTYKKLPHWFQPDTTTFVTFRTADSLPQSVIEGWKRELETWLQGRKLPLDLADHAMCQNWQYCDQVIDQRRPSSVENSKSVFKSSSIGHSTNAMAPVY